jgi:hypothetical protein
MKEKNTQEWEKVFNKKLKDERINTIIRSKEKV